MYHPDYNPNIITEALWDVAKQAKLDKNVPIKKLIFAAGIKGDFKLTQDIFKIIAPYAYYEMMEGIPFPLPSQDILEPQFSNDRFFLLGKIKKTEHIFFHPSGIFPRHLLLVGESGCGKSNLLFGICLQAMLLFNIPVWIIDRDKVEFRNLKYFYPDLLVFDAQENFLMNPLEVPQYVKPQVWLIIFVLVFAKTNNLLDGSENLLIYAVQKLYEEAGIFKGQDTFPTIIDLYEKIKNFSYKGNSRTANFQASILNRLEAYIALNRKACEYSRGYPLHELAKKSFVLEVRGLTERISRFTINIVLYSLFLHRIASGQRGKTLRSLFCIDECKYLACPG